MKQIVAHVVSEKLRRVSSLIIKKKRKEAALKRTKEMGDLEQNIIDLPSSRKFPPTSQGWWRERESGIKKRVKTPG